MITSRILKEEEKRLGSLGLLILLTWNAVRENSLTGRAITSSLMKGED
jgi:hypothetical protein